MRFDFAPLATLLVLVALPQAHPAAPTNLLTEWHGDGAVVRDPCPEFYWELPGQTACQVVVSAEGATVWDSGKLNTPVTVVEYAGPELAEGKPCSWRVKTWDADGPGDWTAPMSFTYQRRVWPMVKPHIRTFMNFGGKTDFAVANLDMSFRAAHNEARPDILVLRYSLLATMVIPSPKADALEEFCVQNGLTEQGILEEVFCHFRTDKKVTLHVGAERASNPRETRLCPGWDPANDRNGDGKVDDEEAENLANPKAHAREMKQARIPIYFWGPPRDDFVMNVGHPVYQRFVAEVYCPGRLEAVDGLYVDTMPADVAGAGRSADVLEFPRPPTDPHQWLHAMQMMLARIKVALPDIPMTGNGWNARPFVMDGRQAEGWMRVGVPVSQYQRVLESTVALDRRGKIQMIQFNPIFDEKLAEFGRKVPITPERDAIFGLATYYLVHGDCTYYAFGSHPYRRVQEQWPQAAAVDIGTPTGPYRVFAESDPMDDLEGENLLPNGDFELDADGDLNPDEWVIAEPVALDAEVRHSGNFSARITSDSRKVNNFNKGHVTLKPNTAYTIVCWIKTENVVGDPGAQVYPYEFDRASGGGMITVTGTTAWKQYHISFTTSDDPTGRINFRMYGATGTVWFDDIRLLEGGQMPWKVFARDFTKVLVLTKPYCGGKWDDATATEHALPEALRPLQADGALGDPVTMVALRSGEAAVLVRQESE